MNCMELLYRTILSGDINHREWRLTPSWLLNVPGQTLTFWLLILTPQGLLTLVLLPAAWIPFHSPLGMSPLLPAVQLGRCFIQSWNSLVSWLVQMLSQSLWKLFYIPLAPSHTAQVYSLLWTQTLIHTVYFPNVMCLIMTLLCLTTNFSYFLLLTHGLSSQLDPKSLEGMDPIFYISVSVWHLTQHTVSDQHIFVINIKGQNSSRTSRSLILLRDWKYIFTEINALEKQKGSQLSLWPACHL